MRKLIVGLLLVASVALAAPIQARASEARAPVLLEASGYKWDDSPLDPKNLGGGSGGGDALLAAGLVILAALGCLFKIPKPCKMPSAAYEAGWRWGGSDPPLDPKNTGGGGGGDLIIAGVLVIVTAIACLLKIPKPCIHN